MRCGAVESKQVVSIPVSKTQTCKTNEDYPSNDRTLEAPICLNLCSILFELQVRKTSFLRDSHNVDLSPFVESTGAGSEGSECSEGYKFEFPKILKCQSI